MNKLNKLFKLFLAALMLGLPLAMPLTAHAEEASSIQHEDDQLFDFEADYDFGFDFEDDVDFDFEDDFGFEDNFGFDIEEDYLFDDEWEVDFKSNIFDNELDFYDMLPQPAYSGYVPEIMFADDTLLDLAEEEIFTPITPTNSATAAAGSGVVQFVLEPVNWNASWGTIAQARAAAFNARTVVHRVFPNQTTTEHIGVNGRYGRDAIFLGRSANGNRYRVMIAGHVGYVNRTGQQVNITVPVNGTNRTFAVRADAVYVPFGNYPNTGASVQTVSHYVNRNGELFRYLTNNVTTAGGFVRFLTGPAPGWMPNNIRMYSFDGVYFYTNPRNIRIDGQGSLNAGSPFFNYFQYLSFRAPSTVTAAQLNSFLTNNSAHGINTTNSIMRNQGNAFINAQNRYGINALLMYAKAMHESAGGTSSIAINNNNLFGLGAVDSAPNTNAWHFASPAASVNDLANGWLSRGYLWPGDWRYAGPHAGHKGSGMNVRYAMDPYWGQKIAGWAFRIDRTRPEAQRDINREQIAVRQNTSPIVVQNASGGTLYTANTHNYRYFPFLISAVATNNRLRIVTDPAISNGVINRTALFNRATALGYIPHNNVWFAGRGSANNLPPTNNPTSALNLTGVTRTNTVLRQGPGSNYTSIRNVNRSSNLRITGYNSGWYLVVMGNNTGWIRNAAISRTHQIAVVNTNNAHVRTGRGTSFRSLTRTQIGAVVPVTRQTANWSRITINGHTGWIQSRYLGISNGNRPGRTTVANVAVHTAPNSNFAVRRRLPRHANVMILQRTTDGWTQINIRHSNATLTGWVRTNQIENRVHTRRVTRSAALRQGPNVSTSRIRTLNPGSNVTVRSRHGNWYNVRITLNGRTEYGWVQRGSVARLTLPAQP